MAEKTDLPTEEEVGNMKLTKLARLLQQFGITEDETDEMDKEEARDVLRKRIRDIRAAAATRRRPGQATEKLTEILGLHKTKRERLAQLCHDIAAYLSKLEKSGKDKLRTQFGRAAEDIVSDVQAELHKEECPVLVAGETSSGKSTFLNLLLGENILPVAHMSSTSTICEVKYGETRQAVVHLRTSGTLRRQKTVTIRLDGTERSQAELKSYMHLEGASRDSLPPAERVEIFFPLPLLKGGIVIVDSPGVGESDVMDKVVADYIPKCFAFLYIIDSSRAGGVQQDRLGQLLKHYTKKKDAQDFNPESAMFICNKWDTVPTNEQEKVKSETLRKLSKMWPGLEESQVFYVSTKKAVGPGGILSADFTKVLDGLDLLLPKSLDIKLDTQYRLLTQVSKAALTHFDVQLNVARQSLDKDYRVRKYREAKEHVRSFQEKAKQDMEALASIVRKNIKTTKDFLSDFVKTGKWKKHTYRYQSHLDFPDYGLLRRPSYMYSNYPFDKLKHSDGHRGDFSIFKAFYGDLADNPAHCPWFEELIVPMEKSFEQNTKKAFGSLKNAYQETMHDSIFYWDTIWPWVSWRDHMFPYSYWGLNWPWRRHYQREFPQSSLRGRSMSCGKSIGKLNVVLGSKSQTEFILYNCWDQAPAGTPLIDILMQALESDELLTELVERQVQPQRDLMALLQADITKMETMIQQGIEESFEDSKDKVELVETYEEQNKNVNHSLGQLAMFHLTEMRKYEYDLDSICITGCRDRRNKLGARGGLFGKAYHDRVQVPWKGAEIPAALKMQYDTITSKTAWNFLKEEGNLRKLQGDHIVEYYGTACRREGGGLRLGLVMELCEGTLEDRIIGNRDHNPAWWGSNKEKQAAAFSYTQNLAVQLCEGLKHIHGAGFVHRDLKLSNIMVTRDNIVKLAGLGKTEQEVNITGTTVGTPLYAAPEVKKQKKCNRSADIYSLGLILLEMWYGRTLYELTLEDDIHSKMLKVALKRGWYFTMPQWPGTVRPNYEWASLIRDCLKEDPTSRPKIQDCLDRISAMNCKRLSNFFF